jgi:hypothetical protein
MSPRCASRPPEHASGRTALQLATILSGVHRPEEGHRVVPPPRSWSIDEEREVLRRYLDTGGATLGETEIYEELSDPDARYRDKVKRSRNGQYLRRLRRLKARRPHQ